MRILVTRALEDAQDLADELSADGIESILAPMLSVEFLEPRAAAADVVAAYAITSRNGAEALGRCTTDRATPVFAVGEATAERLREHGFAKVESANGDAAALAALIRRRVEPEAGPLVFLSAETVAGNLEAGLLDAGYDLRRIVAYRSEPAHELPREAAEALRKGQLDGALFFSPRTARTFVSLVEGAELTASCNGMTAYCISDAVADSVRALPWSAVRVAAAPTKRDLLSLLADHVTKMPE
ncbi:uroporphyrinogen-III synthase [Nisaea acidiphila]|uniref:Uroporphyrinogen-III synthase n=1 Tax=Nisaea acidiphila TaxID=1862145 RepID=A0A9J7AMX0_9PROT|nr:uroporphyrinogen-III synthase [Nisaea acidiphila]UUX48519.1 uroporphyrinogen-III synthase [Nisaea acidiphila]